MTVPPVDRAALVATRRDLHQHPELGFEERRTGALVAERLQRLGYAGGSGVGKTGGVGLGEVAAGGKDRGVLAPAVTEAPPLGGRDERPITPPPRRNSPP